MRQVNAGLECGIGMEGFNDWEVGDTLVAFNSVERKRTLEEASTSMSAAMEELSWNRPQRQLPWKNSCDIDPNDSCEGNKHSKRHRRRRQLRRK